MSLCPQRVDFDFLWGELRVGVEKIITLSGVKGMPMMEDIYKLCTAQPKPFSEELYNHLKEFLEDHASSLCEDLETREGSDILAEYRDQWSAFDTGTSFIHAIFYYLNNNWIRKRLDDSRNKLGRLYTAGGSSAHAEVYDVKTLSLVVWRQCVLQKIKDRLVRHLLECITKERDGEMVDVSLVAGVINSLVKLGGANRHNELHVYSEHFETPFLASTHEYYKRESVAFIAANGVSSYMHKAIARLEEEEARAKKYLNASSHDKLRCEINASLVTYHAERMYGECERYLVDHRNDDLKAMHILLSRIEGGIDPMLDVLQAHVTSVGLTALRGLSEKEKLNPTKYVEALLLVYGRFCGVVLHAFSNEALFVASLDKAMRKVVNHSQSGAPSRSPELLAKYADSLLSKSNKSHEMEALDETLAKVLVLFKYVDEKDVFQKFYSKLLARRLIHGTSLSDDAEAHMLGGLKQACGYEYTSKLQRMFTDMSNSTEVNERYQEYMSTHGHVSKADFNIMVLTAGSWPLSAASSSTYVLPEELEPHVSRFTAFYNTQHHGRKLSWLYHLSKGELKTTYLKKRFEFHVTNYQMSVLLLFNKVDRLSMKELLQASGLKDKELQRTLLSLIRARIVKKDPMVKRFLPTDVYFLNGAFTSKRLRIKVAAVMQRETAEENKATHSSVDEDRKLFLQAAIVRIMKARKTSTHSNLVQETIAQARARFKPNVAMIKKCIEQLIEKDYIAREDTDGKRDRYTYVA